MGDVLKISKDKRHRSSSSIAGPNIEGTRSERKLDIRGSIPEVEDQFAVAEARCNTLQEKIDIVKVLKKKKKLKKRSMTRMMEQPLVEAVPFIKVVTQPKKKVSVQAARHHRLENPQPARRYLDPATAEQRRMVRGYSQNYKDDTKIPASQLDMRSVKLRTRRAQNEIGGGIPPIIEQNYQAKGEGGHLDADQSNEEYETSENEPAPESYPLSYKKVAADSRSQAKSPTLNRTRQQAKEMLKTEGSSNYQGEDLQQHKHWKDTEAYNRRYQTSHKTTVVEQVKEERSVVELFNKNKSLSPSPQEEIRHKNKTSRSVADNAKARRFESFKEHTTGPLGDNFSEQPKVEKFYKPQRSKTKNRRYEQPTIASQMKQAGIRQYYQSVNHTNIPFVVTKSTAPSHNIGINIQQVLNSLKIQQPLSTIPLSIAYHMGLGHVPTRSAKSGPIQTTINDREMNSIKMGQRMVYLPNYKYQSFSHILSMYREGDGVVSRFLRTMSRPHYFYTSMYNLATHQEDPDAATSKGGSQEAKQCLAEYASLYREYEQADKLLKGGAQDEALVRKRDELSAELAAREDHIRRLVHHYKPPDTEPTTLRASASTAEENYRFMKPNVRESH